MTKRHFIALADALRATKPKRIDYVDESERDPIQRALAESAYTRSASQWDRDVSVVARFCRSQNPAFMEDRWRGYINGENGPNGGTR
jgi:hypothetical protein